MSAPAHRRQVGCGIKRDEDTSMEARSRSDEKRACRRDATEVLRRIALHKSAVLTTTPHALRGAGRGHVQPRYRCVHLAAQISVGSAQSVWSLFESGPGSVTRCNHSAPPRFAVSVSGGSSTVRVPLSATSWSSA